MIIMYVFKNNIHTVPKTMKRMEIIESILLPNFSEKKNKRMDEIMPPKLTTALAILK